MRLAVAFLLFLLGAGSPAAADIYKCPGPDGETLYTTDPTQCPGAGVHDLKGQVQSVESSSSTASTGPARLRPSSSDPRVEAALRASWQAKKREAQQLLVKARGRIPYLERMVTACNRGAVLYSEDEATGIRSGYSCDDIKAEHAEVLSIVERAEHFLAEGLEEQCRRAGCLPGWIR